MKDKINTILVNLIILAERVECIKNTEWDFLPEEEIIDDLANRIYEVSEMIEELESKLKDRIIS